MQAGQVHRRPARHGRNQHGVRATHVCAVDPRAREAQRNARSDRVGAQRPGVSDRPDAFGSRRVPREGRAQPSGCLIHDLAVAPEVFSAYADASPDLIKTADNATRISQTIVDEQNNLDAFLVSLHRVGRHRQRCGRLQPASPDRCSATAGTDHRSHAAEYNEALYCGIAGMLPLAKAHAAARARASRCWPASCGAKSDTATRATCPRLRRRAVRSAPACRTCRMRPFHRSWSPTPVPTRGSTETPDVALNFEVIKRLLFGDIDGPPRNSAQIGQPG